MRMEVSCDMLPDEIPSRTSMPGHRNDLPRRKGRALHQPHRRGCQCKLCPFIYFQESGLRAAAKTEKEALIKKAAEEFPKGANCKLIKERLKLDLTPEEIGQLLSERGWEKGKSRGRDLRRPPAPWRVPQQQLSQNTAGDQVEELPQEWCPLEGAGSNPEPEMTLPRCGGEKRFNRSMVPSHISSWSFQNLFMFFLEPSTMMSSNVVYWFVTFLQHWMVWSLISIIVSVFSCRHLPMIFLNWNGFKRKWKNSRYDKFGGEILVSPCFACF